MRSYRPLLLSLSVAILAIGATPPSGKAGATAAKPTGKTLANEGITPRALLYIRDLSGTQKVQLREAARRQLLFAIGDNYNSPLQRGRSAAAGLRIIKAADTWASGLVTPGVRQ